MFHVCGEKLPSHTVQRPATPHAASQLWAKETSGKTEMGRDRVVSRTSRVTTSAQSVGHSSDQGQRHATRHRSPLRVSVNAERCGTYQTGLAVATAAPWKLSVPHLIDADQNVVRTRRLEQLRLRFCRCFRMVDIHEISGEIHRVLHDGVMHPGKIHGKWHADRFADERHAQVLFVRDSCLPPLLQEPELHVVHSAHHLVDVLVWIKLLVPRKQYTISMVWRGRQLILTCLRGNPLRPGRHSVHLRNKGLRQVVRELLAQANDEISHRLLHFVHLGLYLAPRSLETIDLGADLLESAAHLHLKVPEFREQLFSDEGYAVGNGLHFW
mmetsp:Transcript_40406/g.107143  ORF Transcript_40406/g.107143 Transcript_40406/m.107143 type:complete len:326 (-) Transcript_40406:259-1236(-)